MKSGYIAVLAALMSFSAFAAEGQEDTWADSAHRDVGQTLHSWANSLDAWLGEPDPNKPATANVRIIMDTRWNHYDHISFKPRIRAKLRLPGLKNRLSLVMGDETLDNELQGGSKSGSSSPNPNRRRWDSGQARDNNSSLALRWSDFRSSIGVEADIDIGIRRWNDPYLRFKLAKDWQLDDNYSTRLEAIYRYGLDSRNYLRGNGEIRYTENERRFIANQLNVEYVHNDDEEKTTWGNSLFRQHNYANYKQLNYGVYVGGDFDDKKMHLNTYGPYIQWRQPIWRKWLFIQPEVNYYNDRDKDRNHAFGVYLRLEAIF